MKIGYCEDETAQAEYLKKRIEAWADKKGVPCRIDLFGSAEEFLFKADCFAYDLLLLDISMSKISGMELARRIRENDANVKIVFITSDQSHVFEGYEVNAFRYLMKPIEDKKLIEVLDQVSKQLNHTHDDSVILKIDGENVRLTCDEVTYLEVQGHYVQIRLASGKTLQIKDSFANVLAQFNAYGERFVASYRSYAVNLSVIRQIGRTECVLTDDTRIPVSRSAYKSLNNAFIQYHLKGR